MGIYLHLTSDQETDIKTRMPVSEFVNTSMSRMETCIIWLAYCHHNKTKLHGKPVIVIRMDNLTGEYH